MIAIVVATNLPLWPRCQISHFDRALQFGTFLLATCGLERQQIWEVWGQRQIWGRVGNKYGQGQQSDVLNEIFRFAARSTFLFAAYWLPSSHPLLWNHFRPTPSCYTGQKLMLRKMFFFTVKWSMNHCVRTSTLSGWTKLEWSSF